jgi:hypothetical protein
LEAMKTTYYVKIKTYFDYVWSWEIM